MAKLKPEFWDNVLIRGLEECWPWLASTRGANYGQCSKQHHESRSASRAAFEKWNGVLLGSLLACHTCDNTICCSPLHLFAGTHEQNTQDALSKGRFKLPPRHRNTKSARRELALCYENDTWRLEQGKRIAAGHLANKARQQEVVKQFTFNYGSTPHG